MEWQPDNPLFRAVGVAPAYRYGDIGLPSFDDRQNDRQFITYITYLRGDIRLKWKRIAEDLNITDRKLERWRERVQFVDPMMHIELGPEGDNFLDNLLRPYISDHANAGIVSVVAHAKSMGYNVPLLRVHKCMMRLDPVGLMHRRPGARIQRVVYTVKGPLHLVHIDGNDNLILWGLSIQGAIDGFSHVVLYLQCNTNKLASTSLQLFENGCIHNYGVPGRVRLDKGGEFWGIVRRMLREGFAQGIQRSVLLWARRCALIVYD
jgi:hypothetical protein